MATTHRPIGDILANYDTWRAERAEARTQGAWHRSDVAGIDLFHELVAAVTSDRVDAASEPEPTELVVLIGDDDVWWEPAAEQGKAAALYRQAAAMVAEGVRPRIEQVIVTCPAEELTIERLTNFLWGGDDPAIATVREVQAR